MPEQVQEERNGGDDQQEVDRAPRQVQADPHHQPNAQQQEEQDQKQKIADQPHITLLHV